MIGCPAANVVGNTQLSRRQLPLLIRPAYTFTDVSRLIIRFLEIFNYTHTAVISDEDNKFYYEFGDSLAQRYRRDRRDLYKTLKLFLFRSDEATDGTYETILSEVMRHSRGELEQRGSNENAAEE